MLKVLSIRVKGFTPMRLNDIEEFTFDVLSDKTIILGGNGSGKSSLLRIFFPVAPNKNDFKDGGFYENTSVVDQATYLFRVERHGSSLRGSITNLTTGESVVEEVNPKVYNAKVEELTGLTKELKELINGEQSLTRAPTALRRQWFTKLSSTDLSTPLSVYGKLKNLTREAKTEITVLTNKISDLKSRVVDSKDEWESLIKRMENMNTELRGIDDILDGLGGSVQHDDVHELLERITPFTDIILETPGLLPNIHTRDKVQSELNDAKVRLTALETRSEMLLKQLSALRDEKNRNLFLSNNLVSSEKMMEESYKELNHYRETMTEIMFPELMTYDIRELTEAKSVLVDFSIGISENIYLCGDIFSVNRKFEVLDKFVKAHSDLNNEIIELGYRRESIIHELEHCESTSSVECPKCSTQFKPGVVRSVESIRESLNKVEQYILERKEQLREALELVEFHRAEYNHVVELRSHINSVKHNVVLNELVSKAVAEDVFGDNREQWGGLASAFEQDLSTVIQLKRLTQTWESNKASYEKASMEAGFDMTSLETKITQLSEESGQSSLMEESTRLLVSRMTEQLKSIDVTLDSIERFERLWDKLQTAIQQHGKVIAVNRVKQIREEKLDTFSAARERYRVMQNEMDNLAMWQKDLETVTNRHNTLKLMVEAWSPEKGVLKRYFYNSIARISDMMTSHISNVWSHPLKVFPCDLSDGNMDYMFPFQLKDDDELTDDVSCGSTAQQMMFDLSFRIATYAALGFNQFPLLLDEPGTGFDEEHRGRLVDFIKSLMERGMFSQIIVVSHLTDIHSKLSGADYVVLSQDGVSPPVRYNEGVTIKYYGD